MQIVSFSDETKEAIFKNANGACEECGKELVFNNLNESEHGVWDAHHIISDKDDSPDSAENGDYNSQSPRHYERSEAIQYASHI